MVHLFSSFEPYPVKSGDVVIKQDDKNLDYYFTNLGKSVVFLVFGPLLPLLSHGGDSLGSPAFRLLARQMTPTVVAAAFLVATLLGLACFWWYQRSNDVHSPQRSQRA